MAKEGNGGHGEIRTRKLGKLFCGSWKIFDERLDKLKVNIRQKVLLILIFVVLMIRINH